MIKAVVKYWGEQQDQFSMPIPYHSYLVVSSPWQTPNSGIASIVPLSTNAPLARQHFAVIQGGERAAFEAALSGLSSDPGNAGLNQQCHEE